MTSDPLVALERDGYVVLDDVIDPDLMGHVDQQDPGVLLDPDVPTDMVWKRMR